MNSRMKAWLAAAQQQLDRFSIQRPPFSWRWAHGGVQRRNPPALLSIVVAVRSRRLVTAFPANQRGRGGVTLVAQVTGLSRNTMRRGQRELAQPDTLDPCRI